MANWKQVLFDLYCPDVGSIWGAPNKIWENGFANGKPGDDLHPAIVEKNSPCNTITYIIPGTSKIHVGSCIFRVLLNQNDINKVNSYFLIKFSMPYSKSKINQLIQGWNNVINLNEEQLKDFKMQLKFCNG
jgi:hypothetical protein